MELQLSMRQLAHLKKQINSGRPLWAILTINEYLEADNPLRAALVRDAHTQLKNSQTTEPKTWAAIMHGMRKGELDTSALLELASEIGSKVSARDRILRSLAKRHPFTARRRQVETIAIKQKAASI